jgi:hypothetical protein
MARLLGRAGRLAAETGGFRPGQEHSNDNLAGIGETNMIFYPGTNEDGYGGLHDCCPPTSGWQIEGFVCEHYAAPGTFMIGLNRAYADAEAFCQSEYHGHLASIHTQASPWAAAAAPPCAALVFRWDSLHRCGAARGQLTLAVG